MIAAARSAQRLEKFALIETLGSGRNSTRPNSFRHPEVKRSGASKGDGLGA
jgi:hypothetical protein